ncbi:MAG: hypothetical protein BWX80_03090 [Candidatus Hydrogenedentes bacterium ADurb.Bin101]|nr:MAG: hypothetical protein BWX80_03090 [Candidatus Hydrogenedentes bacterium ADurb.Bin101]
MEEREHALKGAFRQFPVPHFTPPGARDAAHFTHRPRREIVMQEEAAEFIACQFIEAHFVSAGAQRGRHNRLGFPAGKQGATVYPRQDVEFNRDGAYFIQAASVHAQIGLDNGPAHDAFLEVSIDRLYLRGAFGVPFLPIPLCQRFQHLGFQRIQRVETALFLADGQCLHDAPGSEGFHLGGKLRVDGVIRNRHLFHADPVAEFIDTFHDCLDVPVSELQRLHHEVVREFMGLPFHHADGISRARHNDVKAAVVHFIHMRIYNQSIVNIADTDRADGFEEGHLGNMQGRGCRVNRKHVGVVDIVRGKHRLANHQLVQEPLGKQGTQRTVRHTADQDFPFRGA